MMEPQTEQCLILDEHRYHAHPHLVVLGSGTWLMVANRGPRRQVTMHPPQDPDFVNILMRSEDEGRTWSAPVVAPGYGWTGTECAGLTTLGGSTVLLNQWRFRWFPVTAMPCLDDEPLLAGPEYLKSTLVASTEIGDASIAETPAADLMPWARGGGETWAHVSDDDGLSWTTSAIIDTAPFSGGYGMRGGLLVDGEILLPLSDVPHWQRIFIVRSLDGGLTWGKPVSVADVPAHEFEEPSIIALADGALLMLLRENVSRSLFVQRSHDRGVSWSAPAPTGVSSYPAHLVMLSDGRLIAVTGRREPPFGIEIITYDDVSGRFDTMPPISVRTGLPNRDLGYPTAAVRADGSLYVAYYYRNAAGVTGLYATTMAI